MTEKQRTEKQMTQGLKNSRREGTEIIREMSFRLDVKNTARMKELLLE
jgi:hypothetical protein